MINDIDFDDRTDRQHFDDIYENMLNVPNPQDDYPRKLPRLLR